MSKQEYIIKKFVKASSVSEALSMDTSTSVSEIFLVADKPNDLVSAIGFHTVPTESYIPYDE